jgi:putative ABC transport system substrate-binding protein
VKRGRAGTAVALALWILGGAVGAHAQPPTRVTRIGYLAQATGGATFQGFRQGLRELGWIEGQNLVIEFSSAEGNVERLPALAAELVRLKVDVIVTTSPGAPAAKSATKTIPIVFVTTDDPVAAGLVVNLGRPGGNITGLTTMNAELDAKRITLLKETIPSLTRMAVLLNRADPSAGAMLAATQRAARSVGVQLQVVEVKAATQLDGAIAAVTRGKAEALAIPGSAFFFNTSAELAAKARLPAIAPWRQFPEAGGLMSYGVDALEVFRRAAAFVDKILKGAGPGELPVEQPTKFELVVNLRAAKALGLTIPQSVLVRADETIQ